MSSPKVYDDLKTILQRGEPIPDLATDKGQNTPGPCICGFHKFAQRHCCVCASVSCPVDDKDVEAGEE